MSDEATLKCPNEATLKCQMRLYECKNETMLKCKNEAAEKPPFCFFKGTLPKIMLQYIFRKLSL